MADKNQTHHSKDILVVGGAGYIGSHMVWRLAQLGQNVIILDNLSSGFEDAVLHGTLIKGDISNTALLDNIFSSYNIDSVIHFASSIQVGESMTDPKKYYENNVVNGLNLLKAMVNHGIGQLIFSSTAAIFGNPQYTPIDEDHPRSPINTYGKTKQVFEEILADYDRAYGVRSVCLRYFNAAGAHPEGLLGERHEPETHLIPIVIECALGLRSTVTVHGNDYPTKDGTCIRDYIHVMDLAEAHWLALQYLNAGGSSDSFNLGNGTGYSIKEVITAVEQCTNVSIPVTYGACRAGDPATLIANPSKSRAALDWRPQYSLKDIVTHAWKWHSSIKMRKNTIEIKSL